MKNIDYNSKFDLVLLGESITHHFIKILQQDFFIFFYFNLFRNLLVVDCLEW